MFPKFSIQINSILQDMNQLRYIFEKKKFKKYLRFLCVPIHCALDMPILPPPLYTFKIVYVKASPPPSFPFPLPSFLFEQASPRKCTWTPVMTSLLPQLYQYLTLVRASSPSHFSTKSHERRKVVVGVGSNNTWYSILWW